MSNLTMHWINDLPGTLTQIRRALRPDGLFLASMLGGDTLIELRHAITVASMERTGGLGSHLSPLANVADVGGLLGGAGFSLTAVDVDTVTIMFPDAMSLLYALQDMGENNAVHGRQMRRQTLIAAAAVYQAMYGREGGAVPATFQVIYMSGWAPHASQQKAKTRGSAQACSASSCCSGSDGPDRCRWRTSEKF
ncbi:hypothetical protein GUITHDRAFT_72589 [Guillardia theta CCMP2712]|uniref:Methyltransferase type 11 domain-containing protein n=1 Tax=Guillardia theta (strain CCMP2712) TaxID=905079 RepID=L1J5X6_GUITC|nr:hypothetical protein GUITHDRAFT_72589 [Guillardia theta CCMP2712]EKX43938.1 hypothetical protein GUITHDRAFT_72589 [Guillardia theta CCMP2712]|eukprot:XP_005830918.1 hypothetical protein GUITHDRAFT_72589 [Guillardia theta CCMP2712]